MIALTKFFLGSGDFLGDPSTEASLPAGKTKTKTTPWEATCSSLKTLKIHSTHSTLGRFHQQWHCFTYYGCIFMFHDLLWTSTTVSVYWMFRSSASFYWSILDGTKLQRLGAIGPRNSGRSREGTLDVKPHWERTWYVNPVARYKIA